MALRPELRSQIQPHTDNLRSTNVTSNATVGVAQWFDYRRMGVLATTNTGQAVAGRQFGGLFNDTKNLVYPTLGNL
jgi:hypothetical protein